jgi:hypothetical protein
MKDLGVSDPTQLLEVCRRVLREEQTAILDILADHDTATTVGGYRRDLAALDSVSARYRDARRQLLARTVSVAQLTVTNLVDHVAAIEQLLCGELPLYAHNSLARVIVEAALRVRYLFAPDIDVDIRLLRGGAMLMHSAVEDIRAVSEMRPHIQDLRLGRKRVELEYEDLRRLIDRAGIVERTTSSGTPTGVSWSTTGNAESCTLNLTKLARAHLGQLPAVYRIMSGAPHSGPWLLDDMAKGSSRRRPQVRANPIDVGGTVDVVLASCLLLIEVQARFDGHDPVPPMRANRSRRRDLVEAMKTIG